MPTSTDLVTDLPADFEVFGQAVDTQLKALSPGTTAGDIDYYTSSTAKARLGIGSTGQVLTVAAGVPSWATSTSGSMTQLATGTVASTSVVISSFSASYRHLYLVLTSAQLSVAADLTLRLNADSGANYSIGGIRMNTTSVIIRNSDTFFYVNAGGVPLVPSTANDNTHTIFIENYASSKAKPIKTSANSATAKADASYGFGSWANNAAVTSLTLGTSAGTATFSVGTYTLFGVN